MKIDGHLSFFWAAPKDRKSTRLNSSHLVISYAVFCLKKKKNKVVVVDQSSLILYMNITLSDANRWIIFNATILLPQTDDVSPHLVTEYANRIPMAVTN